MDGKSFTIKPIFWRLIIWRTLPFYIGWETTNFIIELYKGYLNFDFLETAIIMLIVLLFITIIMSGIFNKNYHIVISEGIISGPGTSTMFNKETFSLHEIDKSGLNKQTLYEKISGFHSLRSVTGKKIAVIDFIYGKSLVQELYRILEQ